MLVVLAPPDIVKSPLVTVEEALERKPFTNVAEFAERTPKVAEEENKFVLLAVVENRLVVVAPPCPMENTVVEALVTASNKLPVPHAVSLLYGVVVPMPTLPPSRILIPVLPPLVLAPPTIKPRAIMFPSPTFLMEILSRFQSRAALLALKRIVLAESAEAINVPVFVPEDDQDVIIVLEPC